jgi:hypothetical protein
MEQLKQKNVLILVNTRVKDNIKHFTTRKFIEYKKIDKYFRGDGKINIKLMVDIIKEIRVKRIPQYL